MSLLRQLALRRAHAAALLAAAATGAAGPAAQQQWAGGLHCLLLAMRHGSSSSSSSSSSSAGPDQLPPLRWPSPCSHPRPVRAAAADARPQPPSALQELGLPPQLLEGLQRQGVTSPTPVQAAALAHVLQGRHVAVQSPTGTGKTFAYLLPLLARSQPWRKQQQGVQALVLAPTQELCMQVLRSARALVGVAAGKRIQPVVGGANPRRQVEALTLHKPVMLVCTPGRLAKLLQRQGLAKLLLQRPGSRGKEPPPLRRLTLVLEEADKLLMMGDFRDLARLLSGCDSTGAAMAHLLVQHQVLLVSASLKPATLAAVPAWAHADAVTVSAERALQPAAAAAAPAAAEAPLDDGPSCSSDSGSSAATAGDTAEQQQQQQPVLEQLRPRAVQMLPDSLQHQVLGYARSKRLERVLQQCLQACMQQSKKALVFVGTNASLVGLYEQLAATRMQVGCLHGRLPARERQRVLTRFNRGALRVLLLSDAFALGLDFRGVDVVLQASMPASAKQYVHRAGRAGRMGAAGTVLTVLPEDAVNAAKQQLRRLKLDVQEVVLRRDERDRPAVVPAAEAA